MESDGRRSSNRPSRAHCSGSGERSIRPGSFFSVTLPAPALHDPAWRAHLGPASRNGRPLMAPAIRKAVLELWARCGTEAPVQISALSAHYASAVSGRDSIADRAANATAIFFIRESDVGRMGRTSGRPD